MTRTGTTVKSLKADDRSVTSGSNRGIETPPLSSLTIEIPIVITRNTTARATDSADVNLRESAAKHSAIRTCTQMTQKHPHNRLIGNNVY